MKRLSDIQNYGRSMIELLSVLLIAALLSLGSIAGIRMALTWHESNQILNDVMIQAERLVTREGLNQGDIIKPLYLPESGKNIITLILEDGFDVQVEQVEQRVCQHLINNKHDPIKSILINNQDNETICSGQNTLHFIFSFNDNNNESDSCPEECSSCEICDNGECITNPIATTCLTESGEEGYCSNGTCLVCENQSTDLSCLPCEKIGTDSSGCALCIALSDGDACIREGNNLGVCINGLCICQTDQYLLNNVCTPCPDHAFCDGITFTCLEGYKLNQDQDGCVDENYCMKQSDCLQSGTYCEMDSYAPGATYCDEEVEGSGMCKDNSGIVIIGRNGQRYLLSQSSYMFYWSAKNFCASKGLALARIEEACPNWSGTEGVDGACQNLTNAYSSAVMGWTSSNANDCAKYYVYLDSGRVGHKPYFYSNLQALCLDDGRYACQNDEYLSGEFCTPCPAHATCDGVNFICDEGYWQDEENEQCLPLKDMSCTSQSDCHDESGYYCQYTSYPGSSYCHATVEGTGTCQKAEGTFITAADGSQYLLSENDYMYYWSAKNFCESKGMRLVTMSEACPNWNGEEGVDNACAHLTGTTSDSIMAWTDTTSSNTCAKNYVFLDSGRVGHKSFYYTNLRALCR